MKFPHAYKGVKKLFLAEVFAIIVAVLSIVVASLAKAAQTNGAVAATAGTMGLVAGILLILIFIFQLVGLHQAGKDEMLIQYAFCITILSIILSLVGTILGSITQTRGIELASTFVDSAVKVAQLLAAYYTLSGISALAAKLKDSKMEKQGRALANWVIIFFLISIVFNLASTILLPHSPEWLKVTLGILVIVASVVELVVYVITFFYYAKAVKMLKK